MLADAPDDKTIASTERQLEEDGKKIAVLQDSLQQTLQLCNDMLRQLDRFEARVAAIEPIVMPLQRNLSIIARVHHNVEDTLTIVKMLAEKNELAQREEFILAGGPTMENLDAYLASIGRVQDSLKELNDANLGFCRVTVRRLESANGVAMEALASKYKEWLLEASMSSSFQPADVGEGPATELSSEMAANLSRIAAFAAESSDGMMGEVLAYYGEVRSNYMMDTLHGLFKGIDSQVRGGYQRGSHPFIIAVREFFAMAQEEASFAAQVLPEKYVPDAIRRAIKHPADMVKMSAEAVGAKVSKSAARHEFVEQIWIMDVIEAFNDMYCACPSESIREVIKPALKSVTMAGVDLLKELMDDLQGTSRTTATVTASANATVFEQTSSLLNCLRRMLEYERIVEPLLNRWSQASWDGIVGSITSDSQVFAMALYYQDLLKGLEVALEKYSHGYKKAIVSVLFQLNNYNYILRTFKTSSLATMVTEESEQKYEEIVAALIKEYMNSWRHVVSLLEDNSPRSVALPPKERLKMFTAELEELVRSQEGCAIPDNDLRNALLLEIKELVMTNFISFYNQNQAVFVPSHGKTKLDPGTVESMIGRMFQA